MSWGCGCRWAALLFAILSNGLHCGCFACVCLWWLRNRVWLSHLVLYSFSADTLVWNENPYMGCVVPWPTWQLPGIASARSCFYFWYRRGSFNGRALTGTQTCNKNIFCRWVRCKIKTGWKCAMSSRDVRNISCVSVSNLQITMMSPLRLICSGPGRHTRFSPTHNGFPFIPLSHLFLSTCFPRFSRQLSRLTILHNDNTNHVRTMSGPVESLPEVSQESRNSMDPPRWRKNKGPIINFCYAPLWSFRALLCLSPSPNLVTSPINLSEQV